jgi:hypothetical protein
MKELQCFRWDERMRVQNLGSPCSDRARPWSRHSSHVTHHLPQGSWILRKICFLPNEPKVVQCLPAKLKKQQRAKRIRTDTKPLKTGTKPTQTRSKPPERHPKMTHFIGRSTRFCPSGLITRHSSLITFSAPLKPSEPKP